MGLLQAARGDPQETRRSVRLRIAPAHWSRRADGSILVALGGVPGVGPIPKAPDKNAAGGTLNPIAAASEFEFRITHRRVSWCMCQ